MSMPEAAQKAARGFGVLVTPTFDFLEAPGAFRRSLELFGSVVAPRLKGL
jgi:hypothetical protein